MRISFNLLRDEEGQALIQVTIAFLVLLGLISLAIDVGHVYAERRRMQNAADAGALAGARQLCMLQGADKARAEAARYLRENGVAAADIIPADIQVAGSVVNVTARQTADTFLAGFVGFDTVDVGATASAACGAAKSACGLWPVAFSEPIWEELYDEGAGCGKEIIVWNDDKLPECKINGKTHANICNCYDCDVNNDGIDEYAVASGDGRAWLDFSGLSEPPFTDPNEKSGCGASELGNQIRTGSGARIQLPTCISGTSGIKAGVKDDIDSRSGDHVNIALYDSLGCPSSNCSGESYHVTSFGCITVVGWEQKFGLKPQTGMDPKEYKELKNAKVVRARINCSGACTTACGSTDGTPAMPWQVTATGLTR